MNGFVKLRVFGTFEQRLDEEVGPRLQIRESEELVELVQAGKVGFNGMRMEVVHGMGPGGVKAEDREGKRPRKINMLGG
jgi:hypothetical protein